MTITIPPEALEAAAREIYIEWIRGCLLDDPTASIEDYEPWKHLDELERGHYFSSARAAILAALEAWPGVNTDAVRCGTIILHLPKENPDAEA